jgi:diguanylate cyclase (GGDEF)-like protein/PAS domain S-box-containing protein
MPDAPRNSQFAPASHWRWIAIGRLGAGALLSVALLLDRAAIGREVSGSTRLTVLGLAFALTVLGAVSLVTQIRRRHLFRLASLGFDVAALTGMVSLSGPNPSVSITALALLVIIEGTLVAGLPGGLLAWGGVSAGFVSTVVRYWLSSRIGPSPVGVGLQVSVGLLMAITAGALSRRATSEHVARLAEREGQQRRFMDIVWDLDAIVWEADTSLSQFFFVSHPAERILGYPITRWTEESAFRHKLTHPDDRQMVLERYGAAARDGKHHEFEYRVVTAGDNVIWVKDRVSPVRDQDGKVRQLRGVMVDVTRRKKAEEALRNSFRLLFANNPQPMFAYDRDSLRFLAVNDAAVELYGHSREEILQMRLTDICSPEEVDRLLLDMVRNRGSFERTGEWRHKRRDGRVIDVQLSSHSLEFEGRKASLIVAEDITDRKQAERKLHEAEVRYRTLVEQIPAVTYVAALDEQRSTIYMSPQAEKLVEYSQVEWRADPHLWPKLLHPDDRQRVLEQAARIHESGDPFVCEYRLVARDGRTVWVRDEAILMEDESGKPQFWQGVMVDITERKQAEKEIAYLAYHDRLTGLPNRAMFQEVLDLSIARAKRQGTAVAVLYLDLDDFKLVNDSLGHHAGDELLRQLAARLREATRETDLVSRLGGDEFLLLMADLELRPGEDPRRSVALLSAEALARRVQDALRLPFVLEGTEVYVSSSIGISVFPVDAEDASALLKNADVAMYRSKKERPGGCMIFAEGTRDERPDLSFATRLRKAVEARHWALHYQPIVRLENGGTMGVEALLRWDDPETGIIGPTDFIPLAEEMGLIGSIGDWVLGELCRQQREWTDQDVRLDVTFNLSARQLWEPDLVQAVMTHLDTHEIDPSTVIVEITESAAMTDLTRTQPILWDLHRNGLRLAIDDFGVGYSSLSRLKNLPVDILKIDRFFIRDLPGDREAGSMVEAIIQLANSLGMQPLAEGIETEEQWRFLSGLGCPLGQGFYFSRPLPASDLTPRLIRDRAAPRGRL